MTGGGVEKIDSRTELECESSCSRRVYLLDNNHFPVAQHGEVARLAGIVSYLFHERARFSSEAVQGLMAVREFK
jgi:hypothetical protein